MRIAALALLLLAGCHTQPAESATPPHTGHAAGAEAPVTMPAGHAEVEVPGDRVQAMGLRLAPAERARLAGTVRATGVVTPDETREAHVHSKVMGFVQDLFVNAVGQQVTRGAPLYSIYAQDLLVAQQEYLRARQASPALAAAARERLKLWDIPGEQIALIEKRGPQKSLVVRAPISGTVLEKDVVTGHYVEPAMMLYRIADLSRVWVVADVYAHEVDRLDRAADARIEVQGEDKPLAGPIDYVYPSVDPVSRTVKVRIVLANPTGTLRPGSFATVTLATRAIDAVWVPEEAILDTGVRQVVYVTVAPGRYRPTLVQVGRRESGRAEIRAGLAAGTEVVVGAQFLLDSESQLRGNTAPGGHGGH